MIEILIGVSILGITVVGATRFARVYGSFARVSRNLEQLQAEHTAIKRLIAAIPGGQATFIMCGRPHPWVDYRADVDRCVAGDPADANIVAAKEANWPALSDAYFNWANTPSLDGAHLSPTLNSGTYNSLVVPKLLAAGCINCHDGSAKGFNPGSPANPDFQSFTAMNAAPRPFVSYLGITSKLGRRLLKSPINLQNILLGTNTSDQSGQILHTLTLTLSSGERCSKATMTRRTKNFVLQSNAECPSGIGTPPRCKACNAGEYCDPTTCNYFCGSFDTPVDSQTPAACLSWTQAADCYLPNPPCPVPAANCPAGTTVTGCQEFQFSLDPACGFGATTWRCVDLANPLSNQSNVVLYNLISSYRQIELDNTRQLSSQGALP